MKRVNIDFSWATPYRVIEMACEDRTAFDAW